MSFATTKMTRGSRNPPLSEHISPSGRGGIIDYRNGFSVPMPRASAVVAAAPTRPTKIDIRLENETRAAPARVLSVSYTPAPAAPAPAAPVDMRQLAHQVANEFVCERDKTVAPAAAPAEVSEMEGLRAHLQAVATNQRDMYAQLSAMSQSAQADRTGLSDRMASVESLRAVVQQQSKSLDSLSQTLVKDGGGDPALSSQVLRHDEQLRLISMGLQDHKTNINEIRGDVRSHAADLQNLDAGLVNHTSHIRQMRSGLQDHTKHLGNLLRTTETHGELAEQHAEDLAMIQEGLQNHSEHIHMMTEGLMDHTHNIRELKGAAPGAPIDDLMHEINAMKSRVESWDRNVLQSQQPRDCTARELSTIMEARTR